MQIPSLSYPSQTSSSSTSDPIVFMAANGFLPGCYTPFFQALNTDHTIHCMLLRPLRDSPPPPDSLSHWQDFREDLALFMNQQNLSSSIGIGHSIGATLLLSHALSNPKAFSKLILIEPALFSNLFYLGAKAAQCLGLMDYLHPLVKASKHRLTHFSSPETLFDRYRKKPAFSYISDAHLRIMADHLLVPSDHGGYKLAFSKDWECQIYRTMCTLDSAIWKQLPSLQVPTLIIRADQTNTFFESACRPFKRLSPLVEIYTVPNATHLVPFEYPQKMGDIIRGFLERP